VHFLIFYLMIKVSELCTIRPRKFLSPPSPIEVVS
jgi:hypothetical protein